MLKGLKGKASADPIAFNQRLVVVIPWSLPVCFNASARSPCASLLASKIRMAPTAAESVASPAASPPASSSKMGVNVVGSATSDCKLSQSRSLGPLSRASFSAPAKRQGSQRQTKLSEISLPWRAGKEQQLIRRVRLLAWTLHSGLKLDEFRASKSADGGMDASFATLSPGWTAARSRTPPTA